MIGFPSLKSFPEDTVEILFIDGAKSWRGLRHLLALTSSHFIPEISYLVCQDYKYWGTYWVPIMMAELESYLELVHNVKNGTTVTFRVVAKIPTTVFQNLEDDILAISPQRALEDIDKASVFLANNGDKLGAANVLLSKVSFLAHQGSTQRAIYEFKRVQNRWPTNASTSQLERARRYLCEEKSIKVTSPLRLKLPPFVHKLLKKIRYFKQSIYD